MNTVTIPLNLLSVPLLERHNLPSCQSIYLAANPSTLYWKMDRFRELIAIVERILDGYQDEEDIALLRQWIGASNEPNVVQSGKYNVNIGQGH